MRKLKLASVTLRPIMLGVDYHFWFLLEAKRRVPTFNPSMDDFLSISKTNVSSDSHRNYMNLCASVFILYFIHKYGQPSKQVKEEILYYLDKMIDDEDEEDIFEEKTTKKKKKEELDKKLNQMKDELQKYVIVH